MLDELGRKELETEQAIKPNTKERPMTKTKSEDVQFLSPKEVSELTSLSKSYLPKMADRGEFPKPIKITERRIVFVKSEVLAWIESKLSNR